MIDYECSQEFVASGQYSEIMRRGLPKKGDILFTTEPPLGNVALVDRENVAFAQRIIRFRMDAKHFDLRFTFLVAPPLGEQGAIVGSETAKIDALIAKVWEGIDRLKEYRIALLISTAVTDKIDVREQGT